MFEPIYMKKNLAGAKLEKALAKLGTLSQAKLTEVARSAPSADVRKAAAAKAGISKSNDAPSAERTAKETKPEVKSTGKGPHAFVFMCMGPDPSGGRPMQNFSVTDRGVYEGLVQGFGFTGPRENLYFYGPSWNKTVYSSSRLSGAEADDLIAKIKEEMKKKGFSYNGEPIRSTPYDPSTTYGRMGFFMVCLFVN